MHGVFIFFSFQTKYNETKQKLLTLQHQMQMEKESVKVMEKDLQHLKSENSSVKENVNYISLVHDFCFLVILSLVAFL